MPRPTVALFPLAENDTVRYTGERGDIEAGKVGVVSSTFSPFKSAGTWQCMVNVRWDDGSYHYLSSLVLEKVQE